MPRPSVIVRSVLAFGLVLGVTIAATDAAWTDPEYVSGSFTAATFGIEGSVNGADFASHTTSGSAPSLTFTASSLYPGQVIAAPWAIRAAVGSIAGTVVISEPAAPTGNASLINDLSYRLYWDTSSTCNASSAPSAGAYLAGAAGPTGFVTLGTTPATTAVTVAAAPNATTAGTPVYFCFQVQLSANAANADQGQSASATWLATGTNS